MFRPLFLVALLVMLSATPSATAATHLHAADPTHAFEAGLANLYGFNEPQAVRHFQEGAQHDCVMCHWGMAYAAARLAAIYQAPSYLQPGYEALLEADRITQRLGCTPVQGALLFAVRAFYRPLIHGGLTGTQLQRAVADYTSAMRATYQQFSDDPDIAALFGTLLLSVAAPSCHSPQTHMLAEAAEIFAVLEPALAKHPDHIGLHHIYIHAREISSYPERALASAYALPRLAPELGHLVHMPGHIFARLGMYQDAAQANRDAIAVDLKLLGDDADHNLYLSVLTLHNYHFLWSMLSLRGEYEAALQVARDAQALVDVVNLPLGPWRDTLLAFEMLSHIEMERWDEARETTALPGAGYGLQAVIELGHGLAALHRNDRPTCESAKAALRAHARQITPYGANAHVITLAAALLEAESLRWDGRWHDAFDAYQAAIAYEDAIPYQEPWPWQLPVRNYLAAALMATGAYEEAVRTCDAELAKHPRAPKTVKLLATALDALGDPRAHTLPGR